MFRADLLHLDIPPSAPVSAIFASYISQLRKYKNPSQAFEKG